MKKIRIKHEGGDVVGIVPETWEELKVKHFLALEADMEEADFISTFMGIEKEVVENLTGNLSVITETIQGFFNSKPLDLEKAKKKVLKMAGKEIHFPKSLDLTRYGQKSMLKSILSKEGSLESELSTIFAIYAQPLIDGKFSSARINEVKEMVDEMPILDVYPYVLFFFKKSSELRRHLKALSTQSLRHPSKLSMR